MNKNKVFLDAKWWKCEGDFYSALLEKLAAPAWHSHGLDAFVDSMIYGGINGVEQPYNITIQNTGSLDEIMKSKINEFIKYIEKEQIVARKDGYDSEISFELM